MSKQRKNKKKANLLEETEVFGEFAFIAGYTEGGVPFGILHEDLEGEEETNLRDESLPF